MDIVQKKDVRPFTMLHIDFLDCETLSSNEKILLAILMRYSYYEKNSPSATFPSFAGLAKKTGLAEKVVRTTLQLLEEKQLISKQARYRNGTKARAANFYVIQDTPSIWKSLEISSDDSNLFDDTIKEAIELLQTAGYKVMETEKNKKICQLFSELTFDTGNGIGNWHVCRRKQSQSEGRNSICRIPGSFRKQRSRGAGIQRDLCIRL